MCTNKQKIVYYLEQRYSETHDPHFLDQDPFENVFHSVSHVNRDETSDGYCAVLFEMLEPEKDNKFLG